MEFLRKDTNIDFMGKRRLAVVFSAVLIVIGVALVTHLRYDVGFGGHGA